jgi:type III restriction enzyme
MAKPSYHEVVELKDFNPTRATDKPMSTDRFGAFSKSVAYDGWKRSLFPVEWFDSKPERTVANMVDEDDGVVCWVRLHIGDLPILWNSAGQEYNPDHIVIEGGMSGLGLGAGRPGAHEGFSVSRPGATIICCAVC